MAGCTTGSMASSTIAGGGITKSMTGGIAESESMTGCTAESMPGIISGNGCLAECIIGNCSRFIMIRRGTTTGQKIENATVTECTMGSKSSPMCRNNAATNPLAVIFPVAGCIIDKGRMVGDTVFYIDGSVIENGIMAWGSTIDMSRCIIKNRCMAASVIGSGSSRPIHSESVTQNKVVDWGTDAIRSMPGSVIANRTIHTGSFTGNSSEAIANFTMYTYKHVHTIGYSIIVATVRPK